PLLGTNVNHLLEFPAEKSGRIVSEPLDESVWLDPLKGIAVSGVRRTGIGGDWVVILVRSLLIRPS
ncbi:MAG: hypothetical protein R3C01_16010, partial [Planctomycetaceae bacterium]